VPSRTQIVCLHEGEKGRSIDPVFICALLKALDPAWIRPWKGSNKFRPIDCGARSSLIARMPRELRTCLEMGADTTLMVWADLDDDMDDGEQLRREFQKNATQNGLTEEDFDRVVFIFAKTGSKTGSSFYSLGQLMRLKKGLGKKMASASQRPQEGWPKNVQGSNTVLNFRHRWSGHVKTGDALSSECGAKCKMEMSVVENCCSFCR
jgi:hypothetical protein